MAPYSYRWTTFIGLSMHVSHQTTETNCAHNDAQAESKCLWLSDLDQPNNKSFYSVIFKVHAPKISWGWSRCPGMHLYCVASSEEQLGVSPKSDKTFFNMHTYICLSLRMNSHSMLLGSRTALEQIRCRQWTAFMCVSCGCWQFGCERRRWISLTLIISNYVFWACSIHRSFPWSQTRCIYVVG